MADDKMSLLNPLAPIYYATHPSELMEKAHEIKGDKDLNRYRFQQNSMEQVKNLLYAAGVPSDIIPFAAAQTAFETNGYKSHISKADHNLSGIKWINKPYQKATKGSPAPRNEGSGYYARYASFGAWANDFKRILSIGGANAPIHATDLKEYVTRLHDNGYFTSNPDLYYTALARIMQLNEGMKQAQGRELTQAKEDKAAADEANKFKMPWWGWALIGLGGIVVLKKTLE